MIFQQPIDSIAGNYGDSSWPGYKFKEALGYTTGVHTGVDYNGPGGGDADLGTPIHSIADGIVRAVEDKTSIGFGKTTIVEYPLDARLQAELGCSSLFGRHMHQNETFIPVGQKVTRGQVIGKVGKTGTKAAHLHLDLYKGTISGGGVHWRYDKDTQLSSYLDAYLFIEAHKVETAPQGGNTMAEKVTLDAARQIAYGIGARNGLAGRPNALAGESDADLDKNHIGKDLTVGYLQSWFASAEARQFRDTSDANSAGEINRRYFGFPTLEKQAKDFGDSNVKLSAQVDDLKNQLAKTNADLAAAKADVDLYFQQYQDAKAKLEATPTANPDAGKWQTLKILLRELLGLNK
jgi:hypothetical protein